MFHEILFFLLLAFTIFLISGKINETYRLRKQRWSRYDANNVYTPLVQTKYRTNAIAYIIPKEDIESQKSCNSKGFTPFNPKEPSPT